MPRTRPATSASPADGLDRIASYRRRKAGVSMRSGGTRSSTSSMADGRHTSAVSSFRSATHCRPRWAASGRFRPTSVPAADRPAGRRSRRNSARRVASGMPSVRLMCPRMRSRWSLRSCCARAGAFRTLSSIARRARSRAAGFVAASRSCWTRSHLYLKASAAPARHCRKPSAPWSVQKSHGSLPSGTTATRIRTSWARKSSIARSAARRPARSLSKTTTTSSA